ncbi:hypothetical protein K5M36_16905 [Chromobacterium vaccinii]|nr:hypothetical protein [Chromobacterium vaccinii]
MKPHVADALAIALASKVLESDPSLLLCSKAINPGDENATVLADFIEQLSTRLQANGSDELATGHVAPLIKNG